MKLITITFGIALLSATAVWAQDSSSPAPPAGTVTSSPSTTVPNRLPGALHGRRMMPAPRRMPSANSTFEARVQEMQDTLAKMHELLKQMQSKASRAKGQTANADNIQMWELLLGHLDRTLAEARVAAIQRSAMYQRNMAGQNPGAAPNGSISAPAGADATLPPQH